MLNRSSSAILAEQIPLKVSNEPTQILGTWLALEILSPQSFQKAEDLAAGDRSRIALFETQSLPWENGGEKAPKDKRLYYQVVLGTIDLPRAVSELLEIYTDDREERPQMRGKAVLAIAMVDKHGILLEEESVSVSSFGWGLPISLSGTLDRLQDWISREPKIIEKLTDKLRVKDKDEQPRPLNKNDIQAAFAWLVSELSLPGHLVNSPSIAVRTYQYFKEQVPPDTILLNSFYLRDLSNVQGMFEAGSGTENLKFYLGIQKPFDRKNLMLNQPALADTLQPRKFPFASWPGHGRYPLVTLQQSAVNLVSDELKSNGILAVNGPPGTGKTTLLRDVIADIITQRASIMVSYSDPVKAFKDTGEKVKKSQVFLRIYELDKPLRGHEIIVASSNNKAVENVSAELPVTEAVAEDAYKLRYFQTLSDELFERKTWGLIAAALGKSDNKWAFKKKFWWNENVGLRSYLLQAVGQPQILKIETEKGVIEKIPDIIKNENPPLNHDDALKRWQQVCKHFNYLKHKVQLRLDDLQKAFDLHKKISELNAKINQIQTNIDLELERTEQIALGLDQLKSKLAEWEDSFHKGKLKENDWLNRRPHILHRFFKTKKFKEWHSYLLTLQSHLQNTQGHSEQTKNELSQTKDRQETLERRISDLRADLKSLSDEHNILQKHYRKIHDSYPGIFIDDEFFDSSHEEQQKSAPWLDPETARLRQDLFEAAIAVHKAFIDAAAKPIRHNLSLFMDSFGSKSLGSDAKDVYIPDLWSTFFLTVPVISTTFASLSRMFNRIGPEQLGWLLIDEAGQALPQAAVGGIMRTKRAVVVGDPIQIEPIVALPNKLTETICQKFNIDPLIYNAPEASAQTLADSATSYYGTFETRLGTREVGVPLLVHRRCADPMFSISNSVAYENLMVQAKTPKISSIFSVLGPSRWIHVDGFGNDKWCPEEGAVVLDMLQQLKMQNCDPDLYIVTPFVIVQDRMRELVRDSRILEGWVSNPYFWSLDRIGTVHTVQGREAEAVIFILGAPNATQNGARYWAGGQPNLLNVAVTRAKEALYVVGNETHWKNAGAFENLFLELR